MKDSVYQRIRGLFARCAGMGTAAMASKAIYEGFWTDEELDRLRLEGAQSRIRLYLKRPDVGVLPFAGMTTEKDELGTPVWKQRILWAYDDYVLNIHELVKQRDQRERMIRAIASECEDRYGQAPSVSAFDGA